MSSNRSINTHRAEGMCEIDSFRDLIAGSGEPKSIIEPSVADLDYPAPWNTGVTDAKFARAVLGHQFDGEPVRHAGGERDPTRI